MKTLYFKTSHYTGKVLAVTSIDSNLKKTYISAKQGEVVSTIDLEFLMGTVQKQRQITKAEFDIESRELLNKSKVSEIASKY